MSHFQKWMYDTRRQQVAEEIDEIRSEFPYDLSTQTSGYWSWAASTDKTSILTPPSGWVFNLKQAIITNNDGAVQRVQFFDGAGVSVPVTPPIYINPSTTVIVDDLKGCWFLDNLQASIQTSECVIKVAGFLVASID